MRRGGEPVFELVATEGVKSLTSPNYPLPFTQDMAASWTIHSPGFSDLILLKVNIMSSSTVEYV